VNRRLAALVVSALALGSQPAWAEQTPKVKTIEPAKGPPGTNCVVNGVNFSDKKEDIEVTFGSAKCLVLEATPEKIRFLIPSMPAPPMGKGKVEIKVKGESCSTEFTVEKEDKQKEMARREAERQKYEGASVYEDPYKENDKLLKITKFEITQAPVPMVVMEGETELPKGLFLTVAFGFNAAGNNEQNAQIVMDKVFVQGKTWKITLGGAGPGARPNWTGKYLLAGKYYAQVEFLMAKQSPLDLKRIGWPEKLTEGERVARERVWKREIKDVGAPEDLKKQDDELRAHYVELCRTTTDCLEQLDRAYCSAGKSYFKNADGKGFNEDEWNAWVKQRGVGQTDEDLKKIKQDTRFNSGVSFNADKWKEWVEGDFFKKLGEAYKNHDDLKKKYIGTRDQRVEVEGDYLLTIVLKLCQTYTSEIYTRFKLQIPDSMRAPKEFGQAVDSIPVSRQHFEGHRKLILERLGLSNFDPGKKPDAPKADEKK